MKYDDICSIVAQRAALERSQADRALKATLQTLSERADPVPFDELLTELPPELAKSPELPERQDDRDLDRFIGRVAALEELPPPLARRSVLAVFAAVAAATSQQTVESVMGSLGKDFTALLPPPQELQDYQQFLERVRERAGSEATADAEATTRATLTALAERVTAGQAQDLAQYVPATLSTHLESATSQAQPFDYAKFLAKISGERDLAETYARAVLATIREAAPEPEIQDTLAQLPIELARLFKH